jgi:signal transduction histidine kinase
MTSNIAHELKTPLAIISGYAEGLKEHIADDKRDHYLEVILTETERMDAMVLEKLDLSRLQAGQVKLARDEFSLSKLVSSVFDKLAISAQVKKLKISLDFKTDAVMLADEARITQVVTNLVNNAIKYTLPEGKITVRVDKNREGCRFAIENESSHFTAEQLAKVWDSFYRTDNSQSVKGTGLGLAIVRSIVELHGGRCSVRNTNTGVEFEFIIPDSV